MADNPPRSLCGYANVLNVCFGVRVRAFCICINMYELHICMYTHIWNIKFILPTFVKNQITMQPVINGHIFMQMIFLSRRPMSPFLCLRCLYADKSKRMPILFWLPRGFFFPFSCHCRPEFIATFVFTRPPFTSSFHRPALPLDCCCHGVAWLQWFVWTMSPLNLILFSRDCWSPQQVLITLHLNIYFCSTVYIRRRGTLHLRMVKSKDLKKKGGWRGYGAGGGRIQSFTGLKQERAHTWDNVKAEQKELLGEKLFFLSLMDVTMIGMDQWIIR